MMQGVKTHQTQRLRVPLRNNYCIERTINCAMGLSDLKTQLAVHCRWVCGVHRSVLYGAVCPSVRATVGVTSKGLS